MIFSFVTKPCKVLAVFFFSFRFVRSFVNLGSVITVSDPLGFGIFGHSPSFVLPPSTPPVACLRSIAVLAFFVLSKLVFHHVLESHVV